MEALYGIKNNKAISLSKQQLIDCDKGSNGCSGGYLHTAMEYSKTEGLEIDDKYARAYQEEQATCDYKFTKINENIVKINGFDQCYENESCSNDASLYRTLIKGPVAAVVDASEEFMLYEKGVFDKLCKGYNHAILVVGYGKKEHEGEENYWIVKNSWGILWGDHGYIKIKQSENYNSCFLNKYYVRPFY